MDCIETLRNDFSELLGKFDFSGKYDPMSPRFLKTLGVGLMWHAAKALAEDDDVAEELDGARKYMDAWLSSGDAAYKEMAADELRHAGTLIKKHLAAADGAGQERLESHERRHKELLKMLGDKPAAKPAE